VPKTNAPDPVSSVTAEAKFAEEGVPSQVATPVPSDVMPVPPLAAGNVPVTAVVRLTLVRVLFDPLIVLFVSVWVFDAVDTFDGVIIPDSVVI
jgi:hypothetical protein